MSSVASHAGLTEASLRLQFACKDAMLQAAIEWISNELTHQFRQTLQSASSPLHALEAVFLTQLDFFTRHRGVLRLLVHELQRNDLHPGRQSVLSLLHAYRGQLSNLLEQSSQRGELDTTLDPDTAVTLFCGALQGCLIRSLAVGNTGTPRREALAVFALVRRAIGGPA